MTTTNFTAGTVVASSWLNDVDAATYEGAGVFTPAGTGAVATTVQAKLRESVSVKDFGAVADGVTNDSAAFAAARTYATTLGKKVYAPAGHYKLNTALTSAENLILEGDGDGTILDFSGTVTGGNYGLEATGTLTQIQDLNATATVGTNTVVFTSAPTLSVGSVFCIYNPTVSSWSAFRTNYYAGEWCEVESISGSTVTTKNPLYDTYLAANVDVYVLTSPIVSLSNFSIVGTTVEGLINASRCIDPLISNVKGTHANDSIINFDRCFRPVVNNPRLVNIGDGGDDYGIAVGNSQHARVYGGSVYARRHAVTHGGNAQIGSVPVRDSVVTGVLLKNDIASGTEAADFHGNTEASRFVNCTIYNGANLQGKDNEYVDCTITNAQDGYVIYHAEVKGGRLGARNCKFVTHVNPQAATRGIFDIGGNSDAVTTSTTLPATFFVENCSVYGRNLSTSTVFMRFRNAGTTQKVNFEVNGLTGNVDAAPVILRTQLASGTADSDYVIVDNIKNFPATTTLHSAFGSDYLTFPHRCQKQTGKETLTATSGTASTTGTLTTFRYAYPRAPAGHCTAVGGYNSNRMTYGTLNSLSATQIRPMIESGDATNWTGSSDREVYWTASLDEV